MKRKSYREQDYAFGQIMLNLRDALMLTQAGLAKVLDVSRNTIVDWEAGKSYPKFEHLTHLIAYGVENNAFAEGQEAGEIRALWEASRQKVLLDENWLVSLLGHSPLSTSAPPAFAPPPIQPETPAARSYGFPFQPTGFVGRGAELAEIARILRDTSCRLLTLIGPGGVGKTSLALEAARGFIDAYADGIAFVPLAPVSAPNQIVSAIGDTLEFSFGSESDPTAQLIAYLRERRLLLVLDNFEHLLEGAALVRGILERAPGVTILITSRERLNLRTEWLFDVQGLSFPLADASGAIPPLTLASVSSYSAVQLFVQRAQQVQPDFPLTEVTLRTIGRLCQYVGGMPLAIELAATSVRLMSVAEIDRQISSNLDVLATTLYDVPARHRSLRAVFDHSWNLLDESDQAPFTRLAVFRGGFTIGAAVQVAGADLPMLRALADKSLVRQNDSAARPGGSPRFFMLEPIREYALQKLNEAEANALRHAHARYFLSLVETARTQWQTPEAESTLAEIDFDLDNIRAVLQWAVHGGDAVLGLRIAEALYRYWRSRVYLDEGRQWLEALLALSQDVTDTDALQLQMRATYAAALILADQRDFARAETLFEQNRSLRHALGVGGDETTILINQAQQARNIGEYQRATEIFEEALAISRAKGDLGTLSSGGYGFVLYFLATTLRERGDFTRARALYLECHEFHRNLGDREGAAQGLLGLSDIARDVGDAASVRLYCADALAIYREFGTQWAIGFIMNNLALAAFQENELDEALSLSSESVSMFRTQNSPGSVAEVLVTFGIVLLARGDLAGAYDALTESIRLAWVTGPRLLVASGLESLGCALIPRGAADVPQAVRYLAAAAELRRRMGTPLRPAGQPAYERALAIARAAVGADTFARLWAEARLLPLEQVVRAILDSE